MQVQQTQSVVVQTGSPLRFVSARSCALYRYRVAPDL